MSHNPYERQPFHTRLRPGKAIRAVLRTVWAPAGLLVGLFRRLPWPGQAVVGLLLVAGLAVVGVQVGKWYQRRQNTKEVIAGWVEFERSATGTAAPDELRAALDRVLAANPGEPTAVRRKEALDTLTAPADDQPMVKILMRVHAQAGRLTEAAREANKLLAKTPTDRFARCLAAEDALRRNDRAAADEHLAALTRGDYLGASIEPFALVYSVDLLQRAGRDVTPIRQFIVEKVLPILKTDTAATAPAGVQMHLVACYAIALGDPRPGVGLVGFWAPAGRLAELALASALEAGSTPLAVQVGELGARLATGLIRLRAAGHIPPADAEPLAAELEDRTRRAWRAVRAKNPADPAVYVGLTLSHARAGENAAATETLTEGLKACGDHPALLELFARGMQGSGRPDLALDRVWQAAERHPNDPAWWARAARAAQQAGRRDKALEAVGIARRLEPKRADVAATEAVLWCEAGRPNRALEAFALRPDAGWAADPATARALAHALAAANEPARLEAALAISGKAADTGTAAAEGLLDAPPSADRYARAAALALDVLTRWPDHTPAARVRAAALFKALDANPPPWPEEAVKAAEQAAEVAVRLFPDDGDLPAMLSWLRLRGRNQPAGALEAARKLIASEALAAFPAEAAGAALLANGRPADAMKLLERAKGRYDVSAGVLVQLSRAYRVSGRPADADRVLREASGRTMTARERADYVRAANGG